jgi:hypothetical protein
MATTMTGSEKQIAWAEKIRDEFLAWQVAMLERSEKDLARELAQSRPDPEAVDEYRQFVDVDRAALDAARRQTSAAFWIDSRSQAKATVRQTLNGKPLTLLGREIVPVFE